MAELTDAEALEHVRADVVIAQAARYEEARVRLVKAQADLVEAENRVGLLEAAVQQATRERDLWHAKVRATLATPSGADDNDQEGRP